jgi:hypothetical protein
VKRLLYAAVSYILSISASCTELPRGITSEEDVQKLSSRYYERKQRNAYDTTSLKANLNKDIGSDPISNRAMELFMKARFWHLVDYCEDHLPEMNNVNAQLFREVLILLAPRLDIGNYTQRVVKLIGDPTSITEAYFQNKTFLYDMFFYGAVETAKRGYSWILTETCVSICSELRILAEVFHWDECKEVNSLIVRDIAYDGELTENRLRATATRIWPNLPDALTERSWTA